jgi:hypothetical protein
MKSLMLASLKAIPHAALLALALLMSDESISAEVPKYESDSVRSARAYHILFTNLPDADNAHKLLVATPQARQFETFKSLAQLESKDPGSAKSGGDLGMVMEGEMVKEFEEAVFRQEPFTVSAPFKSAFGWHLTYVTSKSEKPVAAICKASLAAAIARESPSKATALHFTSNARSPEDLHPGVLLHIGDGWSSPLTDGNGDLGYLRKGISPNNPDIFLVDFHIEYVRPIYNAAPQACRRSVRVGFQVNCPARTVAHTSREEYEGRGASGRKLIDYHWKEAEVIAVPANEGFGRQLVQFACPAS